MGTQKMNIQKIHVSKYQQNPQRDLNSACADHQPDTLSTRLWSKLNIFEYTGIRTKEETSRNSAKENTILYIK